MQIGLGNPRESALVAQVSFHSSPFHSPIADFAAQKSPYGQVPI